MDELSDDLHDQPGKVESRYDLGRRPGYELSSPDGERRDGMVWLDFEGLNKVFNIDGPAGGWVERYIECRPLGNSKPHDEEWNRNISEAKKGRDSGRGIPVEFKGKVYKSQAEAARQCGCSKNTVARALGKSYGYRNPEQEARKQKRDREAYKNRTK